MKTTTETLWHADDGNAECTYNVETGREAAQEYVDSGDWGTIETTTWVRVHVWQVGEEGERINEGSHTITLDPEEPECTHEDGHDWQSPYEIVGGIKENPGVWGNGGGVVMHECCMHCGCGKITDTWAQNPSNGEQGLTSISYEPGKYSEQVDKMKEADGVA